MSPPRQYFDNAATSFPKPPEVIAAVQRAMTEVGSAAGRSGSRAAVEANRVVESCRRRAARLFGAAQPQQVLFTHHGTDALNLALHGLLRSGDRVITTVWEHNSVLRPLHDLAQRSNVSVSYIASDGHGGLDVEAFHRALRSEPRLVVLNHASNVTGIVQPVEELGRAAREAGAIVLLDAAQTAGHLPVTLESGAFDLIACPGHKGLLGPLGTGLLIVQAEIIGPLRPLRQGGTGSRSESEQQPAESPDKYEAGNLNVPALFGLDAALAWREAQPHAPAAAARWRRWFEELTRLPRVRVLAADAALPRVEVASVVLDGIEPQVLATLLEEHFGIETRAGLHCAPRAHGELGTLALGGAVRFSPGPFTTDEQLALVLDALGQIAIAL